MSTEYSMDDGDFELFFKEHFSSLCTWCQYKFGMELDIAKEAVHSGFIKLWENRHTLAEGLPIKAYLNVIITNICLDILRHEKVKKKYEFYITQNFSASGSTEDMNLHDIKQLQADIDKAIAELPEQMRRVFELSRYKGLKYAAIAAELDISVKTVETQMSRALMKLRQQLARYINTLVAAMLLLSL